MSDVEDEISEIMSASAEKYKKDTDEFLGWLDERLDSIYYSKSPGIDSFIKNAKDRGYL